MRGALALLIVLAVSTPALGQKLQAKPPAAASAASKLGLRGPVAAPRALGETPADPQAPAPSPLPALLAPLATEPTKPDAARCRLTCAQTYYFCLSADAADVSCADGWGQCRTGCDKPAPLDRIATGPQN